MYNTAARLQSAAHPGDVLVGGPAEPMLRGKVDLAPLGQVELRGKTEPVTVYRVIGVHAVPVRMETPFVGRDRRLASLREALQDAVEARACVLVTVLSPPGVGKSRLAAAFTDTLREEATVLIGQTPSYGEGVTFAPLAELLAQAAGSPSGEAEVVAARLGHRLSAHPDGPAVADRIAQILGVGEAHASDTSWAVRRLLEILAADRPLVVMLEDLHWAEQPMLDLIDSVVERVHGPVLVLCLARPELLEAAPHVGGGQALGDYGHSSPTFEPDRPAAGCRAAREGCSCPRPRPGLRDGRGQPALSRTAHGDAGGPGVPRGRALGRAAGPGRGDTHDTAGSAHRAA